MTIHFFQKPARISPYPIHSMEVRWLGFVLARIHLSDPPELKPVGSVLELVVLVIGKSHVTLGRRSEVSSIESQFLVGRLHFVGPGCRKTLIER
jgi:hypothetical protein